MSSEPTEPPKRSIQNRCAKRSSDLYRKLGLSPMKFRITGLQRYVGDSDEIHRVYCATTWEYFQLAKHPDRYLDDDGRSKNEAYWEQIDITTVAFCRAFEFSYNAPGDVTVKLIDAGPRFVATTRKGSKVYYLVSRWTRTDLLNERDRKERFLIQIIYARKRTLLGRGPEAICVGDHISEKRGGSRKKTQEEHK